MNFKEYLQLNEQFKEPDQTLQSEPGFLYHGSNIENLYDIKTTGSLKTFRSSHGTNQQEWPDGSTGKRSYWSQYANQVWQFAPEHGKPVVIRTPIGPNFKRESTGDFYSIRKIPSKLLQVLLYDGSWSSLEEI